MCLSMLRRTFLGRVCSAVVLSSLVTMSAYAGTDGASVKHGRYLVQLGGCNDCHTPGYLLSEGKVPEKDWLTGDSFGWSGPWGTTYAPNLRLLIADMSEDE